MKLVVRIPGRFTAAEAAQVVEAAVKAQEKLGEFHRALKAAGDALAEALTVLESHHRTVECGEAGTWSHSCEEAEEASGAAVTAWKAAEG